MVDVEIMAFWRWGKDSTERSGRGVLVLAMV